MGKYMRKSKTVGEVALLEVSHTQSSPLGVRTRAKTLALQRLQKSNSTATTAGAGGDGGSYLQLRSRKLVKTSVVPESKRQKHPSNDPNLPNPSSSPCPRSNLNAVNQSSRTSSRIRQGHSCNSGSVKKVPEEEKKEENSSGDGGAETSFGENLLEFEGRERTTRESTPCSLIRDPDSIQTPGSSTRPTNASEANNRIPDSKRRHIPTTHEMDDFFSGAEQQQQRQFVEKYNYDPVNDKPLPGRYEWVKLGPD